MSKQINRIDEVLSKFLESEFDHKGKISKDYPDLFRTLLNITGLNEGSKVKPKKQKPTITRLSVIGTDEDHTIFGLGSDGVPYLWSDGTWIAHT